jgi:general secretion pathway protein G
LTINSINWTLEDTKISDKNSCLELEIKTTDTDIKSLELTVDEDIESNICKKIRAAGLVTKSFELY